MKRAICFLLTLAILAGVVLYIATLENVAEIGQAQEKPTLRPVSIIEAKIGTHAGAVSVFAEVKPRWQVELRSRVSGIVRSVAPQALAGTRLNKGAVLLELETAHFLAGFEEAKYALKNAEFELLKKQKKRDIALKDWRAVRPNIQPPDLAIHLPDVRVAEQSVAASKARADAADFDLKSTVIRAPFDAIVTKRSVSPGQSVNEGDVLFSLLDDKKLDLQVSLSARQWALLEPDWLAEKAKVFSEAGHEIGAARLKRGGGFLDPQSRRYQIFLSVDAAKQGMVLPGQFVRVDLPGKRHSETLKIPESALTQNGFVWFVDDQERLQRFETTALFRNRGLVVVRPPYQLLLAGSVRVVSLPMSAYLPGQQVSVVVSEAAQ
jgi:RND family efflux transporter MFP subunit